MKGDRSHRAELLRVADAAIETFLASNGWLPCRSTVEADLSDERPETLQAWLCDPFLGAASWASPRDAELFEA